LLLLVILTIIVFIIAINTLGLLFGLLLNFFFLYKLVNSLLIIHKEIPVKSKQLSTGF
jgi:uncharacterized protein (DUF58 family)